MRGGDPLFDTNAAIAWLGEEVSITTRFLGRDVAISVVTAGELRYGAEHSRSRAMNHDQMDEFLRYVEVVPIDPAIAGRYGKTKAALRALGKPIPDNDLWIAATAIEAGMTLVSRDQHFDVVPGLSVTGW